ncbi:MAG: glycine cleavage system protein GcvH [Planctomycetota bacterium]|nr:MAG: glycine cleavage system protein GcvH [Planctomycetota bacterium]
MNPEQLKYNPTHEWVSVEQSDGKRVATIGITDFALEQLTDLVYMDLPKVGEEVQQGEAFGEVESVKAVSNLYSPVDGRVIEVHEGIVDNLDQLGQDPYGEGWLIKVELADDATLDHLLDHEAYRKQCSES